MSDNLSISEQIKYKAQQAAMKTSHFIEHHGVHVGLGFAMGSVLLGIAGVTAMAATAAPAMVGGAIVAKIAALASANAIGLGAFGATGSITAAGASILGGGIAGQLFAGLSKLYSTIKESTVKSTDEIIDPTSRIILAKTKTVSPRKPKLE